MLLVALKLIFAQSKALAVLYVQSHLLLNVLDDSGRHVDVVQILCLVRGKRVCS